MPTYPAPLNSWNSVVQSTIKRQAMHVSSISPVALVGQVTHGNEFNLFLSFTNANDFELTYESVQIRLVGQPDQVDFLDPPGAIDYNGNPRVHLLAGYWGPRQGREWMIRFRARRTMATTDLKFDTGIYGTLIPQGHYWTSLSPTV